MEHEYQRAVTRVCVQTALLLLQHGAESTVVVQMAQRLGVALGVESVECALTANAVVLTTLSDNHCITTARKNTDKGINMQMVTDVQRIVIAVEHHLYDLEIAQRKLDQLKPLKYNRWLVVFMIGLSCASFAHLSGGDWIICGITIFMLKLLDDMLFAAIPAVGFALVFNVPPKALKYCAILVALGHVTRTLLLHINMPIVFATFFATCVIGFLGVHLSHRYLAHPKAFTVAAIIPCLHDQKRIELID